jgi:hypothetical protein
MALVDGAPLVVTGQLGGAQGGVLRTWRWTGALFAELATHPWAGAAGFDASGPADCPALLLPADGVPLLAWTDLPGCGATAPCGLARVARLSGPGWQLQGTAPGGYSGDRFALDESGAVFCAGCCPPASAGSPLPPGTPGLCRFSGGNWTPVAAPVTPLSPFYLSWDFQLAGPPITLSSEGTLFRWSGSAWGMLTRGPSGKGIAVEPGGAVVAIGGGAYDPSPPYLPRLSADRWAGDWSPLGSAPPTIFSFLRFATDGAETWVASSRPRPTFASAAAPLGGDVRVVRSSGGAWEYVGDPLPAVCNAATFQVEALALGAGKAAVLLKDSGSGDLQVWGIDR